MQGQDQMKPQLGMDSLKVQMVEKHGKRKIPVWDCGLLLEKFLLVLSIQMKFMLTVVLMVVQVFIKVPIMVKPGIYFIMDKKIGIFILL